MEAGALHCPHCGSEDLDARTEAGRVRVRCRNPECGREFEVSAADLGDGTRVGERVVVRR